MVVDQDAQTPLTEAVIIRENQLQVDGGGPGISVASEHGAEVTIEGEGGYILLAANANSQMTAVVNNNSAKGISVMSGSGNKAVVVANDNQLTGGTMAVSAIDGGSSVLRLTNNQIDAAKVGIGANGYVSANGNTISGSEVADDASLFRASGMSGSPGGLTNGPVSSNSGLSPEDVSTGIDFDGNGCADYPPSLNERKPETGQCGLDGVPPVSEPGA